MPGLSYTGSATTGHETYPPTTNSGGSGKVFVGGKAVLNEANAVHDGHTNMVKPYDYHAGTSISGSSKVFVEGSPAIRIGDVWDCGDVVAQGNDKTVCA